MNASVWHAGNYPVAKEALQELFNSIWWKTDGAVEHDTDISIIPIVNIAPFGRFAPLVAESTKEALFAAGDKA